MDFKEVIGLLAGIFTTIAAIPQIIKAWRTKEVKDVSPWMFVVLIFGVGLWTGYGIILHDYPIILTNGLSTFLNGLMLALIFKYR